MTHDEVYLRHVLEAIARIEGYVSAGREAFFSDQMPQDAVIRQLAVIGEAVKHISVEARSRVPQIPWREMNGLALRRTIRFLPVRSYRLVPIVVVTLLANAAAFRASHASECESSYLREAVEDAELVFAGTVLSIEWTRERAPEPARSAPHFAEAVTFAVDRTWRGPLGEQVKIYSSRRVDCGRDFEVGQRYLIYADRRPEDGRSLTTCCHRGGPIEGSGIPSGHPRGLDDVQDGMRLEMEELDRLAAPAITSATTRDADEIRALWDRYVGAIRNGEASEAAAVHCPEMTVLFERWRDLALYEPKERLLQLHVQELLLVLGLRHRLGAELEQLSRRQLLEKSYRERWHGWVVPLFLQRIGAVRVLGTEARGFTDDGHAISGVPIRFRRVDDRWCYDKAASFRNTFSQPDNMRLAIEQMASSEGKSLAEMLEKSVPGDSVWPVEVDSTIWEPLLRRP